MAWEVRFFADRQAFGNGPHGGPCLFDAEADALTHAHPAAPGAGGVRGGVPHGEARRRAVYRLRAGRMVALAHPP